MKRLLMAFAISTSTVGAGTWAYILWRNTGDPSPVAKGNVPAPFEIVRLNPPPERGEVVDVEAYSPVEFLYSLRNNTTESLQGVKVGLACACEATESPPSQIAPGETARFGFRLRAPDAGVFQRRIEVAASDPSRTLVSLDVALKVKFNPPALRRKAEPARVVFVDKDDSPRELAFEAVECADSPSWITGLELQPKDLLPVVNLKVEEAREVDSAFVARVYRFQLSRGSLKIGTVNGTFRLQVREGPPATPSPIPLSIDVLDRVAIVPNPLFLEWKDHKAQPVCVHLVRRSGEGAVEALKWDHEILDVRREGNASSRAAKFEIVPRFATATSRITKVTFDLGGGETRELTVHLVPETATAHSN